MNCPICRHEHYEAVWRHPTGMVNGLCLNCGHVYVAGAGGLDVDSAYDEFGQSYGDEYLLDPEVPLFAYAQSRSELLRARQPNLSAVLEVGTGYGHFLHILGSDVFRCGLEPSPIELDFARQHFSLDFLVQASFEQVEGTWPGRALDAVCSFHVLEHVRDPHAFLAFAKERLSENGILMVAVPELATVNPDLIELYFLRRGWHLHTFSEASIKRLFAVNGLEIIDMRMEQRTKMLRSSMLVTAKVSGKKVTPKPLPDLESVSAAGIALKRFHTKIDHGLATLRQHLIEWKAEGSRIAIYGGGMHTQALFELAEIDLPAIECVVDDDPAKAGVMIAGIPCVPFNEMCRRAPDIVIISTLASEDALLSSLPSKIGPGTRVLGVYRDFFS